MRVISVFFLFLSFSSFSQVNIGDVAFVGVATDNPDAIEFVVLRDFMPGETLTFTDNGWKADQTFRDTEGNVIWTVITMIPKGTVVTIEIDPQTVSHGSISAGAGGMPNLSSSGDQIFAYTGSVASPTLIAGINMDGAWLSDATSSNNSSLPTVFSGTNFALAIDPEVDNAVYSGPTGAPDANAARDLIVDIFNWTTSNTTSLRYAGADFILPVKLSNFEGKNINGTHHLHWTTAQEINNSHFEVMHSTDGRSYRSIGRVEGHGNSDVSVDYGYEYVPAGGGVHYYQIRQEDFDGSSEIFGPIYLYGEKSSLSLFNTVGNIELRLNDIVDEVPYSIYNTQGQLIRNGVTDQIIDIQDLEVGSYILRINDESIPFVVIR